MNRCTPSDRIVARLCLAAFKPSRQSRVILLGESMPARHLIRTLSWMWLSPPRGLWTGGRTREAGNMTQPVPWS